MEKPPMEWIDNLFTCMKQFYGERWTKNFSKSVPEDLIKTIWQTGLQGLTYDEIKRTLVYLKRAAEDPLSLPPIHLEFFRYAKNKIIPPINYERSTRRGNTQVARRSLDEIRSKLSGYRALK